jgi:hypothetical protein
VGKELDWRETINMFKAIVLVEGQTEERFIKQTLKPYLEACNITPIVTVLATKEVKDGPNFKGGIVSYSKVKKHIKNLLNDSSAIVVTTMFDYYGIPSDFPGYSERSRLSTPYEKVEIMEKKFSEDIINARFIPYLQLHEFEALLFSSPDELSNVLGIELHDVKEITNVFSSPEEINEGPRTAPSKRILGLYPKYNKKLYGALISSGIGIDLICNKCPHFKSWIDSIHQMCESSQEVVNESQSSTIGR